MSRRCEEDGCRKHPNFGFPGGRPVRCVTHRLDGMVGSAAAGIAFSRCAPVRLRLHRVRRSNCLCGFAGGCHEPQMRRGWLPQTSQLWLPRGQASAMRHAQARWHGRQCCSWHCIQQMCPSEAALAQGTIQQLPVWVCRRMS